MMQLFQNMRNGDSTIVEGPMPKADSKSMIVESIVSLISIGTERMLVDFGKSSYLQKALQQPEKVKQVLKKAQTDGVLATWDAVNSKLDTPLPLGYNCVGRVIEVGSEITEFQVGDLVVANGPHATHFRTTPLLTAKIPQGVSAEEAVFTVIASIGLQGVRLASPSLGETFLVIGVGLIGLLTTQILTANGCRVLAVDFDDKKLALAKKFGAQTLKVQDDSDVVSFAQLHTRGRGVDGVLITAATSSNEPVSVAARSCRKKGRIVLVGVSGLELNRAEFFDKELSFQVSCSYGPGRYDKNYEEKGVDYPIGQVRWTENRNFEAILDLMAQGKIKTQDLITHRFAFTDCVKAFDEVSKSRDVIGALLSYKDLSVENKRTIHLSPTLQKNDGLISFIGAGNYASRVLIPAFQSNSASFGSLITRTGVGTAQIAKKFSFKSVSTDLDEQIGLSENSCFVVTTQHNSHASMVYKLLSAGKHVFVEKPLAIQMSDLNQIKELVQTQGHNSALMVGFNRRFSPHGQKMKELLSSVAASKFITYNMNAGAIPKDHWTRDLTSGGGRIVGEACHAIDFVRYVVGSKIVESQIQCSPSNKTFQSDVCASIQLKFEDGSLAVVNYFSNGSSMSPKETIEAHVEGKTLYIDNFIRMKGFGWKKFNKLNLWKQDKGQKACVQSFLSHLQGAPAPISIDEIFEVAEHSILLQEQCNKLGGS